MQISKVVNPCTTTIGRSLAQNKITIYLNADTEVLTGIVRSMFFRNQVKASIDVTDCDFCTLPTFIS